MDDKTALYWVMTAFAAVALIGGTVGKKVEQKQAITLKHFKPSEFGIWWPLMAERQLRALDRFRELWGAPVVVSPASGGIGRESGDSQSQHNVLRWGEVRATDFFPLVRQGDGWRGIQTEAERRRAFETAQRAGFTGIGIYTDTVYKGKLANLVHGDTRTDRAAKNPATWARVNGEYTGLGAVIA